MSDSIRRLDADVKEVVRSAARLQLQHFRGLASGAVRKRGRLLAASGRLEGLEAHEFGATARVDDDGSVGRVMLLWDGAEAGRCSCSAFARRATCAHTIALLDGLLAALGGSVKETGGGAAASTTEDDDEDEDAGSSLEWLTRVERYREVIDESRELRRIPEASRGADAWGASRSGPLEVRYVLRFVDRRTGRVAQLEAQARTATAVDPETGDPLTAPTRAASAWRTVPFSTADRRSGPGLAELGEAHASVAAIASGVPDSSWYLESIHRDVALARVDRTIAAPLLHAAAKAGEFVFLDGAAATPRALALDLDGPATLELAAVDESLAVWTVRACLRLASGQVVPVEDIDDASADGLLVVSVEGEHGPGILVALDPKGAVPIALDLRAGPLRVPREDAETLSVLAGVATLVGDGLRRAARPVEPVPCLRVDAPLHSGRGVRMECYLHFDYGGSRVLFDDRTAVVQTLDGRATPRQFDVERERVRRFFELGGKRTKTDEREECDASVRGGQFIGMAATLLDEGWRVVAEDRLLRPASAVSVSVKSGVDWFDLEGSVSFGKEEIAFPRVLEAAVQQRGYVELDDGSHGLLPDAWLKRWTIASVGKEEGDAIRFDESQAWVLAALVDQLQYQQGDPFAELRAKLSELGAPRQLEAPPGFVGELRAYQREGLGWLAMLDEVGLSGCLADDMGLGKTVQLLAYLLLRRGHAGDDERHSLVVAPRSLVFNWIAEAARFAPQIPTVDFTGPSRWRRLERAEPGSLLVTTYGALRRDALKLKDVPLDVAILDEAQAIKTRTSQTAKSARVLDARRRVALSGTPIENHLGELWSLLEFLNPGMLGAAPAFERLGAPRAKDDLIDEGRELLARALRPFMLRRKKSEVLKDLPPKTEQVLRAPLAGAQKTAYEELTRYYRSELVKSRGQKKKEKYEDPTKLDVNVLAALTRLRQCACHPGLVDRELVAERSGKLDLVVPMLTELTRRGAKAIVFSSFTKLLGLVRTRLETERVPYVTLDGSTTNRAERVERFQSAEDGLVFLISIKAGGAGLNLTAADYVFILDPWWNPAVEAQAVDRAHRIGRTRPVHVYRVLTEDTIEAHVVELQTKKHDLAEAILSGATSTLGDLTTDDLAFLLS